MGDAGKKEELKIGLMRKRREFAKEQEEEVMNGLYEEMEIDLTEDRPTSVSDDDLCLSSSWEQSCVRRPVLISSSPAHGVRPSPPPWHST